MRYVALLRAINVGGRVVKMDALRRLFASLPVTNVGTFIQSGNVVFDSRQSNVGRIERAIEQRLQEALGYEVKTFVRSLPELSALVGHPVFAPDALGEGASLYVAFTREPVAGPAARKLLALRNEVDDFQLHDRHVLWIIRGRFGDSKFSGPLLERTLDMPATVRNATTVTRLVTKYAR